MLLIYSCKSRALAETEIAFVRAVKPFTHLVLFLEVSVLNAYWPMVPEFFIWSGSVLRICFKVYFQRNCLEFLLNSVFNTVQVSFFIVEYRLFEFGPKFLLLTPLGLLLRHSEKAVKSKMEINHRLFIPTNLPLLLTKKDGWKMMHNVVLNSKFWQMAWAMSYSKVLLFISSCVSYKAQTKF